MNLKTSQCHFLGNELRFNDETEITAFVRKLDNRTEFSLTFSWYFQPGAG